MASLRSDPSPLAALQEEVLRQGDSLENKVKLRDVVSEGVKVVKEFAFVKSVGQKVLKVEPKSEKVADFEKTVCSREKNWSVFHKCW